MDKKEGTIRKTKSGKYQIDYYDADGNRHQSVVSDDKDEAREILDKLLEEKKYIKLKRKLGYSNIIKKEMKVEELFNRFSSRKEKEVRPRTMDDYRAYLRFWKEKHIKKSEKFAPLSQIEIEDYIDELLEEKGFSRKTANLYLYALRQVYRYAEKLDLIADNPAENVKKLKVESKKSSKPEIYSSKEIDKILKNANDFYRDLFTFFLNTGMRRDEVRFLEWEDIDFKNKEIHIRIKDNFQPKHGKERMVPFTSESERILKKRKKKTGYVFSRPDGKHYAQNTWQDNLKKIAKKAGVEDVKLHKFRHTFATRAVEKMNIVDVKNILGHSKIETTMRYVHRSRRHMHEAMENFEY